MSDGKEHVRPGHEAESEGLVTMTFGEHLDELRRRLVLSILAVVGISLFFMFQKDRVMDFVTKPYQRMWASRCAEWFEDHFEKKVLANIDQLPPGKQEDVRLIEKYRKEILAGEWEKVAAGAIDVSALLSQYRFPLKPSLISTEPLEDFLTFMMAALLIGMALASPIVLHQMWRFIAAGLYERERRVVMRFLPASILLFVGGITFGFTVMVPIALGFLTDLSNTEVLLTVGKYFRFLFLLTIALGFVFQLPVVMVGLTKVGVTSSRMYIKYWRHVILVLFIVGAVFTPPDPVTQVLMAGPMVVLFVIGVLVSRMVEKKRESSQAVGVEEGSGGGSNGGAGGGSSGGEQG